MGEIVFGKTIKLFRSVYVLSLLNRYAEQGLTSNQIINEMRELEGCDFTTNHVKRWIDEINGWGRDYGYDGDIINDKNNTDDRRIPIYNLKEPVKDELYNDMIKILFGYLFFDHTDSELIHEIKRNHNIKKNLVIILSNLFYALENNLNVEICRENDTGRTHFLYKPNRIVFSEKLMLYGIPQGLNQELPYSIDENIISVKVIR